jgi:phage terminase large subunit-like protein
MSVEVKLTPLLPWQRGAIQSPYTHTCLFGGIGSGKSFTLSHFVIDRILREPAQTGIIGANSHDQLSGATLRELFHWLEEYRIPFVINRMPPAKWNVTRAFKSYNNVLTIFNPWTRKASHAFTRILSDPDALRGLTASWFGLDESRDTPENTFDVLLGRLRESENIRTLICTTTNGYDWVWRRFVRDRDRNSKLYGCYRVTTVDAVNAGVIPETFLQTLLASYSPLLAEQEIYAKHVNTRSGRAYYQAGPWNRAKRELDPTAPLIIGCDFNFSPAPMVWVVGQIGDDGESLHVYAELSGRERSTREMTRMLIDAFPGYFFRIFGDASGRRGTTSNAGEDDYAQISQELDDAGISYTIDVDPANPLVKDRVENVNRLLKNALGEVALTYDADRCPLLAEDLEMVGWKDARDKRYGKLDDGGNVNLTHASDALGYALYRLFPPRRAMRMLGGIGSAIREEYGLHHEL